jgi:hypothetical protein
MFQLRGNSRRIGFYEFALTGCFSSEKMKHGDSPENGV